jgi:hypothetical protein
MHKIDDEECIILACCECDIEHFQTIFRRLQNGKSICVELHTDLYQEKDEKEEIRFKESIPFIRSIKSTKKFGDEEIVYFSLLFN